MLAFSEAERLQPGTWVAWVIYHSRHELRQSIFGTAFDSTPSCWLLPVLHSTDHLPLVILSNRPKTKSISSTSALNQIAPTVLNFDSVPIELCPTAVLNVIKRLSGIRSKCVVRVSVEIARCQGSSPIVFEQVIQ